MSAPDQWGHARFGGALMADAFGGPELQHRSIRMWLSLSGLPGCWSAKGPTQGARKLRVIADTIPAAQRAALEVAFWLAGSGPGLAIGVLAADMPRELFGKLMALLAALASGPHAIARWCGENAEN